MRVVGVIQAGREFSLRIMVPYLLRERHIFDHIELWLNCVGSNKDYLHSLERDYNGFFKVVPNPNIPYYALDDVTHLAANLSDFWGLATDWDTLYVKIDDDIVWWEEGAIEGLVNFRIEHPPYFQCILATINNTNCNYLFKEMGVLPVVPDGCTYSAYCKVCLVNEHEDVHTNQVPVDIHNYFLDHVVGNKDEIAKFHFRHRELREREITANQVYAFFGRDYAKMLDHPELGRMHWDTVSRDEYRYLTETYPQLTGELNAFYGGHLCSHLSYNFTTDFIYATDIPDRYRALSETL